MSKSNFSCSVTDKQAAAKIVEVGSMKLGLRKVA